jgi:hypothetical protein
MCNVIVIFWDSFGDWLFWLIFLFSLYWFFFFKAQNSVSVLLPQDGKDAIGINLFIIMVMVAKVLITQAICIVLTVRIDTEDHSSSCSSS